MEWLITVRNTADLKRLAELIRGCGGQQDEENPPIPLGDSELVVQASGPAELPDSLKSDSDVIAVYPNSEMELY